MDGMGRTAQEARMNYRGTVTSLDIVAAHGEAVIFKEIIRANNIARILKEIERNGLAYTKSLARQEFPSYYNRYGKLKEVEK